MNPHLHERFRGFRARVGLSRWDITPPAGAYARNWGAAKQWFARALAFYGFHDQVFVLAEQEAAPFAGAAQQFRIGESHGPVLLRREHINAPSP